MVHRAWQDPPGGRDPGGGSSLAFAMPRMTPLVKLLIGINAGVFLASYVLWLVSEPAYAALVRLFALYPGLWEAWFPFVPIWQLLTYSVLHSVGDLFHLLGNMLFLFFLGSMAEELIGSRRLLALYVSAAVLAGLCQLVVAFVMGTPQPILGASGAVLAVVVAVATLRPDTRIIFIVIPMTLKVFALIFVGMDVFHALNLVFKGGGGNVAYFAHLAGAAYGFGLVRTGAIWKDPVAELEGLRSRRVQTRKRDDDRKVDALLERIHKEGIHSLTERERAFLKRMSRRR